MTQLAWGISEGKLVKRAAVERVQHRHSSTTVGRYNHLPSLKLLSKMFFIALCPSKVVGKASCAMFHLFFGAAICESSLGAMKKPEKSPSGHSSWARWSKLKESV